jgi:nucleoid-associated protein YgaU
MGLFDFARDAGAKLGLNKSTASVKAAAAQKKAADAAVASSIAAKANQVAAAAARNAFDATAKVAADKALVESNKAAEIARKAATEAALEVRQESEKSVELEAFVAKLGLNVTNLDVRYNDGVAYVSGEAASQSDLEKAVIAIGNVGEVHRVVEIMTVAVEEAESVIHTVESGDTLSKIAKEHYGDASKYPVIFEANKPMLTHPDKIFPGQALRIPAL